MRGVCRATSLVFLGLLLATGCSVNNEEGTKPGLRVRDPRFDGAQVRLNNAGITDDVLRNKIAVEATNGRRTATDTLEVWMELRNRTDYPLQVECRVRWYDRDQAPVDVPSAWQRVFLGPNALETFRESSVGVLNVAYYYIEIREGR